MFAGFSFRRFFALLIKELIQMKRDRATFSMLLSVPLIELLLFGYAINADPKHHRHGLTGTKKCCGVFRNSLNQKRQFLRLVTGIQDGRAKGSFRRNKRDASEKTRTTTLTLQGNRGVRDRPPDLLGRKIKACFDISGRQQLDNRLPVSHSFSRPVKDVVHHRPSRGNSLTQS